jgi:hypothetical protein
MMFLRELSLALLSLFAAPADAFSVGRPSALVSIRSIPVFTRLYAKEEKETDETLEVGESTAGATDILNSPAFLQRKLDVLKSDVAAVAEDLATAKDLLKAGKDEYGPQLDDLQSEVCTMIKI